MSYDFIKRNKIRRKYFFNEYKYFKMTKKNLSKFCVYNFFLNELMNLQIQIQSALNSLPIVHYITLENSALIIFVLKMFNILNIMLENK